MSKNLLSGKTQTVFRGIIVAIPVVLLLWFILFSGATFSQIIRVLIAIPVIVAACIFVMTLFIVAIEWIME
jgi:hypothetical protein